jgi:Xaa-Pro aminopeptidase
MNAVPPLLTAPRLRREEFARRRRQLMQEMGPGTIAILPAAPVRYRNSDVEYQYRQDSDFWYLTGFAEPEAVAVLVPERAQGEFILFVRDRDAVRELWDGSRAGTEGAVRDYGADDAFPSSDIDEILPGLIERCSAVYHSVGLHPEFDQRIFSWVNGLRVQAKFGLHTPQEFVALDHPLHEQRLVKSRDELGLLRHSATIAVGAHERAMRFAVPGRWEYEVAAELLHEFHRHRADISYSPIVGGGNNSCVLHYRDNSATLHDGDFLLIDAGCEYEYYASDITRTFPVNGRFTKAQRAIYDLVHAANLAAIEQVRPGRHWDEPHMAAVNVITAGLVALGLLQGKVEQLVKQGAYREFFMHRTGHWLGMDVHDVGEYKVADAWREFAPGMVTTIEPGLYFPPGNQRIPAEFRGIGVRIEDDVAVTRGAPEVLTGALVKDADGIEAFIAAVRR